MVLLAVGAIFELINTLNLGIPAGVELYRTLRRIAPEGDNTYPELSDGEVIRLLKQRAVQGMTKWQQELDTVPDDEEEPPV